MSIPSLAYKDMFAAFTTLLRRHAVADPPAKVIPKAEAFGFSCRACQVSNSRNVTIIYPTFNKLTTFCILEYSLQLQSQIRNLCFALLFLLFLLLHGLDY